MNKVVILGTAHGSNVPGKCSPDKTLREYRYSREMCRRIKDAMTQKGVKCIIDIESDVEPSLNGRVRLVNNICAQNGGAQNCIYISIHNNAAGANGKWYTATGFTVFVAPNASSSSKRLALCYTDNVIKMSMKGNRCWPTTKYYTKSLAVCRDTHCPAILTENGFQDSMSDVKFLLSEEGKQKVVDLHVKTICDYLGI